jgi:starvation-inducible DNA-binding protein
MYQSPSPLAPKARAKIAETLNARLADGLDLHSQIKVAHWNIKGPQFAALHPLFETFAVDLANHNDSIAERAVTLGASSYGTVR